MQTYILDAALPPKLQRRQDKLSKKWAKERQKEEKKKKKKELKEQKKREKELKKQAKQQGAVGYTESENTLNLSQCQASTTAQIEDGNMANGQELTQASTSLSTIILLGAALLMVGCSALFYRKRQTK
ncbi:MAG: hypothetical protein IJ607_03575 [Bacteroidaceae bacterium]|nr:hypothetical protein [Bacteroidaceae bacterium]